MRVVIWLAASVAVSGCFRPAVEIICDPGTAAPCDAASGCSGTQHCNEAGTAFSVCECAAGTGGGGGSAMDGGWPDIELSPSQTLDLGTVAFVPGAGASVSGVIVIRNVGNRPMPPDATKNLLLGPPLWTISGLGGSKPSELCAGTFDACSSGLQPGVYDSAVGLVADGQSELPLAVRLTPDGPGRRAFQLNVRSNDPDEPEVSVTITASSIEAPPCDVELAPSSLDFGLIAPPGHKDLGVLIRNRRTGPNDYCGVSRVLLLGETGTPPGVQPIFSLPDSTPSFTLAPGATKLVRVRASVSGPMPATLTRVEGRIAVEVLDPLQPRREASLTATLGTPCLIITPSSHDFRTVARGCNSAPRQFQIFNLCTTTAFIDSTSMMPSRGEFVLTSGPAPGARVLPDNATPVTFSTRYHPIDDGLDLGAVVLLVTQDDQQQRYVVPLAGTGALEGLNTDVTIPGGTTGADVLLVIDDSCSMEDKQDALATNMASFLQYATSHGIDFRIGVTNTELQGPTAAQAGLLRRSPSGRKFLTPSTPNLAAEFERLVSVGITGFAESCMEPAMRALIAPNIYDPAKNGGFLRDDASLAVVCVTDARDQAPRSPPYYLDQLINVKGAQRQGQFTYNVIGPFRPVAPSGCVYDDPNDGRHDLMVRLTHGVKEEICTPNWAASLTNIGTTTFGGQRDRIYLASPPDLSMGLVVKVDGVVVPEVDAQTMMRRWTFDPASNSVTFDANFLPPLGSRVSVSYVALCAP